MYSAPIFPPMYALAMFMKAVWSVLTDISFQISLRETTIMLFSNAPPFSRSCLRCLSYAKLQVVGTIGHHVPDCEMDW